MPLCSFRRGMLRCSRIAWLSGWRAYLVPRDYGGNLDCDQATCTQLVKFRGGTEVVTRCMDAGNRDIAQRER